jgi:hypothetical protein
LGQPGTTGLPYPGATGMGQPGTTTPPMLEHATFPAGG